MQKAHPVVKMRFYIFSPSDDGDLGFEVAVFSLTGVQAYVEGRKRG